jgi:predicted TIM-barrel fold metal-dependent hydrolase
VIIDAHHHLWDPADRPYPWMDDSVAPLRRRFDADDLAAVTGSAGVTATIVVQAAHDPGETAWLLSQPGPVAGVVGWTDLTDAAVADVVASVAGEARVPLVGIRHQAEDEPDAGWLARPDVARGVRAIAAAGLVYDLLVREREHAAALSLVDAVPEGSFVLDHAAKPDIEHHTAESFAAWARRLREFAERPNVVCKVSGLFTEAGPAWRERPVEDHIRAVVDVFGPDRAMFGSDWPVSTLATEYADVVGRTFDALTHLDDREREKVSSGTASRVYGLATTVGA